MSRDTAHLQSLGVTASLDADGRLRLEGLQELKVKQAEEVIAFAKKRINHLRAELMGKEIFAPKDTPCTARVLQLLDKHASYQVVIDGNWSCPDCKGTAFWIDRRTQAVRCALCTPPAPGEAAQWEQLWPKPKE